MSANQPTRNRQRLLSEFISIIPLIIFSGLLIYFSFNATNFLSLTNLKLVLLQSLPVMLICIGLSAVVMAGGDDVVSGGIDLSIPATSILCAGIIASMLSGESTGLFLASIAALAAALIVGFLNAALVTKLGMTPLLTTLAMFVTCVGVNNVVTQRRRINVDNTFIEALREPIVLGIPLGIIVALLIALVSYHLLHRTKWGLNLQAVGGSRDAAQISGLNVDRIFGQSFVFAAITGFICSYFVLARGAGSSPGIEDNLMVEMVLATFMGAAFSPRRVVTMWGAALGAVLVVAISTGFKSMGVNVFWTGLIKGSLIVVVVATAALSQRTGRT